MEPDDWRTGVEKKEALVALNKTKQNKKGKCFHLADVYPMFYSKFIAQKKYDFFSELMSHAPLILICC